MADINSDGTVTASRLLKFISVQPLDPPQFQYYVKQWSSGDYGTSVMIVAEYSLEFESQRSRLSLPQDSLHNSVDMSLRKISNKGKVEDERTWCWVSDYVRAGEVCFQGANGCNYIPPRLIAITCICVSMCDQDQGRTGGETGPGASTPIPPSTSGGGDEKNPNENEEDKCECSTKEVCDLISEYKGLKVNFTPDCYSFRTSGSTANFSWNEFMGGWSDGNDYGKHRPWGIMDQSVMSRVQQIRNLINQPIRLTSGYRCPAGNRAVGGKPQSRHMHGTAVDIHTGCDSTYFHKLAEYADNLGLWHSPWGEYPDCHLHIQPK